MAPRLIRCRCLRPVLLLGRIAGTAETLMLPPDLAEQLAKSGHVEQVAERPGDEPTAALIRAES